jgi:Tol biopolymer transport system component
VAVSPAANEVFVEDYRNHRVQTVSGDGRYVGFVLHGRKGDMGGPGGLVIYDRVENSYREVAQGHCSRPAFSRDGSVIAFESDDGKIFPGARDRVSNIFLAKNPFRESQR